MPGQVTLRHKYDIDIDDSDLQYRFQELRYFENSALEPSSRRTQTSVERCYTTFCTSVRLSSFPVSFESLGLYFIQFCRFGNTARSIAYQLSLLKRTNRELGHPSLSQADKDRLDDVVTGLQKHDHSQPKQKRPMTHTVLNAMQAVADMTKLRHFQHLTMSRVAHDALLRGGELITLLAGQLIWSADKRQVTIIVHNSKAHKKGPAEHVTITDYGPSSGTAFLRTYVETMQFVQRPAALPLWPIINLAGAVQWRTATPKKDFIDLIQTFIAEAGLPAKLYSGHSFRSGGATDLWASNLCRPNTIRLYGRWKSDAFWLYIRDNPTLRSMEVASAFGSLDEQHRPDTCSVLAATALASFQFSRGGDGRSPL